MSFSVAVRSLDASERQRLEGSVTNHLQPKLLQEFITKATQVEEAELPALLESFGIWSFPRSDLYHWIPVLNRFDAILTRLVDSYDLKNAQNREFTSGDKRLLIEVLKFSAFLMDHCANRSIYSSSNV